MKVTIFNFIILLTFLSCKGDRKAVIEDDSLQNVYYIDNYIESFYDKTQRLPNSLNELEKFSEGAVDTLFSIHLIEGKQIKYIPVYKDLDAYPIGYYLIATDEKIDKLESSQEEGFLRELVTVCQNNSGSEGNVLLSYKSIYLVTNKRTILDLKNALSAHWRNRYFYNVSFIMYSDSLQQNGNLDFKVKKDSLIISASFYDNAVKQKVLEALEATGSIKLKGFRIKGLSENSFRLVDVTINKSDADTIYGKYYDEVGELKDYPHLKGCEENTSINKQK